MPTLNLVRGLRLDPDGEAALIVVEDHHALGDGYVCELVLSDTADPLSPLRREYARRLWTDRRGKHSLGHYPLCDGLFEGRSVYRAGKLATTYFAVRGGRVEVLADSDLVRARLGSVSIAELAALRAAKDRAAGATALPPLVGTPRQVEWAEDLRQRRLIEAGEDQALRDGIAAVQSASFWIAVRHQSVDQLRPRLRDIERRSRRAALDDWPGP